MASKTDVSNINKLAHIILKDKAIDKYQLIMKSGLSISTYDKLKPFLERLLAHKVSYDSKTKIWKAIENVASH